jgi:hypothetical protein
MSDDAAAAGDISSGLAGTASTVLFLHIPKTAGTTLGVILSRLYSPREYLPFYRPKIEETLQSLASLDPAIKSRTRFFISHVNFGVHRLFPGPCTYATIMRDPIARVISHYHFIRRNPEHFLHRRVQRMDLAEYAQSALENGSHNGQTKYLCDAEWRTDGYECTAEHLESAKKNLVERFAAVGLMEQFDASLLLMKEAFGWKTPYYQSENVSETPAPSPEAIQIIHRRNQFDLQLYDFAKQRFNQRIHEAGLSFAIERRLFSFLTRHPRLQHLDIRPD